MLVKADLNNTSISPNDHGDISLNHSTNPHFSQILQVNLTRRKALKGGFALAATSMLGTSLSACLSTGSSSASNIKTFSNNTLGFSAVAKSVEDSVKIPAGYSYKILLRLGDPLNISTSEYTNNGSDPAASFASRSGDHHDGMAYFGLNTAGSAIDLNNSSRGLLCINHENITQIFLHSDSEVSSLSTSNRPSTQIDKEVYAHGVSVVEITSNSSGFMVNKASSFNRRITAASVMEMSGTAKGSDLFISKYSTDGTKTRGTLNNCANGYTPWGTYLTCEENWAGYFKITASSALPTKEQVAQERYIGAAASSGSYGWANSATTADIYQRWDLTPGKSAKEDYRNAANTFGWVVEIDPFAPNAISKKRTALGRFAHEGAMPAKITVGKPLVYYMGDDARGEYIYKFVSAQNWSEADVNGGLAAGDKYLDSGKLYVAKFADDGTGSWIELSISNSSIASYANYIFANQAEVLINARLAADAVGATKMDRPEWTGVNPLNGDVYVTLTNNSDRAKLGKYGLDPSNPRYYTDIKGGTTNKGNVNGHIIRMQENAGDPSASKFNWDIYLFGAQSDADKDNVNISALSAENDFSSPDGLWFSQANKGLLWIQTDDGAYTDASNCMMLAALPGSYGDGVKSSVKNTAVPSNNGIDQTINTYVGKGATSTTLRRFLVGPKGCEITGITETPDGKTLFVNIQHPGENTSKTNISTPANYESIWPATSPSRPRSATIVITKDDGGIVGT